MTVRQRYGQALEELLSPWTILGLILFGIVVTGPRWYPVARASAAGGAQAVIRAFGLGAAPGILFVFFTALLIQRRSRPQWVNWHRALGVLGLLAAGWGFLGLWHPSGLSLAGASLEEVSAGGRIGAALAGSPGAAGWVWLSLLAVISMVVLRPRAGLRFAQRFLRWHLLLGKTVARGGAPVLRGLFRAVAAASRRTVAGARWRLQAWSEERTRRRIARLQATETPRPTEQAPSRTAASTGEVGEAEPTTASPVEKQEAPTQEEEEPHQMALPSFEQVARSRWELPPLKLLDNPPQVTVSASDNEKRAQLIVDTLANYGVDASVVSVNQGPTVTQFGVEPGWDVRTRRVVERDSNGQAKRDKDGRPVTREEEVSRTRVKVSRITALSNDLALTLAAPSIRIEAPVPGKPVVGIEVPNTDTSLVTLRSVVESTPFQRVQSRSKLGLALGKTVEGEAVATDLARMPHLLIAGATGSGKSVCVNSIIACLLLHASPDEVRFLMIDPKRVELMPFAAIPHLIGPVVTDTDEVLAALRWVTLEMESRYRKFAALAVRNIDAYNKSPRVVEHLPYIVVIIDELADLMMVSAYDVERTICRLAQLARATGIHLVIATQRPSVDIVTGLIKANFPTRIAFAVSSQVDSRTILDGGGAEKLLGRGDMLFLPTDVAKPKRLQGTFVTDTELERLVAFWNREEWASMRPSQITRATMQAAAEQGDETFPDDDPLLDQARELATEHERVSTSLLQRRLRVGYPRAAKLIDRLEEEGIVAPQEGSRSRRVLVGDQDEQADSEDAPYAV